MFQVGDYVVCPGHGVGQITTIKEQELGGEKTSVYAVKILDKGMTIMVPTTSKAGIRNLSSQDQIDQVYKILSKHNININTSTWNRRYREYTNKINTGSVYEIAEVLRALFLLKSRKSLSFGERKMLERCLNLLSQEISLSDGSEASQVTSKIESCFSS